MAYSQEQLNSLKKIQTQLKTPEAFQSYVTEKYGADKLQEIKTNLQGSIQTQGGTTPVSQGGVVTSTPIQTPEQAKTQGVNVLTPEQLKAKNLGQQATPTPTKIEPTITPTIKTTETPKIETPKVETKAPTGTITTIDQFKQAGTNVNNLEQLVENRYGTTAQIKGNSVIGDINGERFEWTIDASGNPIKKSLGKASELDKTSTEIATETSQITEQNKLNVMGELEKMLNAGASPKDLENFYIKNKQFGEDIKTSLKAHFKNQANVNFVMKYSSYTPEELFNAYKNGKIVMGDEKYNMLPEELRTGFEEYKRLEENKLTGDAFSFTDMNDKVVDLKEIFTQMKDLFSSNLREEYDKKINSPEMSKLKEDMTSKSKEIGDLDNTIKNLEDDIRAKYPGISEGKIQAMLRREQKDLYRKRDDLVVSYNGLAQQYSMNKEEIQFDLELAKYEDQANRDAFKVSLDMYNTQRDRMDEQEKREFEIKQNELSSQRQLENQKALIQFQKDIEGTSGGDYIDDGKGNLAYVKDGKIISTLGGLGKSISQSTTDLNDYKIYENEDGSYTSFTVDKKTGKLTQQTFNMNGDMAGGYISAIGSGTITSYGGTHDGGAGLDIDGKIGDPIYTPLGGKVIKVQDMGKKDYGKSVLVELEDGNYMRFSHLNDFNVKVGDEFEKGSVVGTMGNTGYVVPGASDGSHLDIVMMDTNGKKFNAYQVEEYLKNVWKGETTTKSLSDSLELRTIQIGKEAYGKNVSDAEGARIEKILSQFPNATSREIIMQIRGLNNIKDPAQQETALKYVRAIDKMTNPPERYESNIADYINRGDITGLKSYMTRVIDNDLKTNLGENEFISSSAYKSQAEATQRVINLIDKNKDKIGAVAGRITDLKKKFSDVGDYQTFQTELTGLLATLRKNFAGSAVTETELKALENYIGGNGTENPYNLITKLTTLNDKATREYINQRTAYGVPITKYTPVLKSKKDLDFLNQ